MAAEHESEPTEEPGLGQPADPEEWRGTDFDPGQSGSAPATAPAPSGEPSVAAGAASRGQADSHNMLPPRDRRRLGAERLLVRVVATCGIIGIGVAIAAIMVSSKSQGWVVGLVVSLVSVILSAILWSSRQL
jgi:hypothetical protein